ncbi:MAG TPA: DHA2 family efflux MFS transporter permease subunit [Methylomirabilota bacterium]|nr:DHA2 family efflux MFS transporter permease subunit [Methylomirabilota bacterium]
MAMVVGMFMAILDIQIVSSSIREIQAGLSASADEITWVQTAYLIAEVIMIPLSGYLSRLLSTRIIFVISAVGFTLMSIGCALATNLDAMIVFRVLQGFIGGAMIPTVFATSFMLFPPERRAGVTVLIGLVATMAPTLGPTLGGYLTQSFSWHWMFLINVLPGIAVALAVWAFVDIDRPDWSLLKGFDLPGLLLMAVFLGSLEYVFEEGPRNDWLQDDTIASFAAISAVSAVLFFWRMFTYGQPIVWLRAFHDRNFAIGSLYSFILGIGLYGSVFLLPAFLGRVRGYNSLQIGILMIVTGVFQFSTAPIAGALSKKLDLRVMLAIGLTLFGAGVYLQSFATADWGFWEFALPQAVRGSALMMCFIPINTLALGTLPPHELKNASGLYNLMRNLGGAIGLGAINTVLIDRLALHYQRLSENITAARPGVSGFLDGLSDRLGDMVAVDPDLAALRKLNDLVTREATVLTFNDALLLMAGVFALALLLMPLIRKPQAVAEGAH